MFPTIQQNKLSTTDNNYYLTVIKQCINDLKREFIATTTFLFPQCQVCFSSLKCSYKTGQTDASLQCTQCAQFLCGSCLYPCTSDSATCTNKLCPLVSTLLTCGVVSNPKSKVFGCPEFRACPKCHSLIMHESGCKFVRCKSGNCNHRFCFICLQDDCRNDQEKYWLLTCKKPRAERQQFMLT